MGYLSKDGRVLFVELFSFCKGDVNALCKLIFGYTTGNIFKALKRSGFDYNTANGVTGNRYAMLSGWKQGWENDIGFMEEMVRKYVPPDDRNQFSPADAASFSLEDVMNSVKRTIDNEMIVQLEKFFKENGHTDVPHSSRSDDPEIRDLWDWVKNVRERTNDPDVSTTPLSDDVIIRLNAMEFVLRPIPHHSPVVRPESRHFINLNNVWRKKYGSGINWNVRDRPHTSDDDKRRPDGAWYLMRNGIGRMIIVEYDESGHNDRLEEDEQKKVYHQCIDFLFKNVESNVQDIHIVRVNGGSAYFPDMSLAVANAEILDTIRSSPLPEKLPYVTVHMLNFDEDHKHVKAYWRRVIDPEEDIEEQRATEEDQWDSKKMYDELRVYPM